ncbi:MAG: hypothetical protein ACMXYE_01215 [Candidatus Woesearchaeota archaeon]
MQFANIHTKTTKATEPHTKPQWVIVPYLFLLLGFVVTSMIFFRDVSAYALFIAITLIAYHFISSRFAFTAFPFLPIDLEISYIVTAISTYFFGPIYGVVIGTTALLLHLFRAQLLHPYDIIEYGFRILIVVLIVAVFPAPIVAIVAIAILVSKVLSILIRLPLGMVSPYTLGFIGDFFAIVVYAALAMM